MQSGSLDRAREVCRECLKEKDEAIRAGRGGEMHRVARRLLVDPELPFVAQLEGFGRRGDAELGVDSLM
eukprot:569228-Pyramimonas_sp.AAC.1